MKIRERLTYANVVSTLCLVLIVVGGGGAAYALGKNTVGSKQIINGSIKTKDVGAGAVTGPKVGDGSLTGADLAAGSVDGGKVQDGSLTGADINGSADGMIKAAAKVASNGVLQNSFNRLGGAISSVRTAAGDYTLTIPGGTGTTVSDKILGVTAYNSLVECKPWVGSGATVTVTCWNTNTQLQQDASFSIWLLK